eukprot:CAMPEP_0181413554 /NCGR_PEP_ID=MMETSP1110-20121109/9034_1 /TAXON_ID=174948 /ORGANISM="Symbiodinium sp., Strain CCMP421" /LENGTH=558 /DNA_ID=CAMNT_0023536375 /DNA_START=95 /DNA_END=1771 /DNA_ORIENTATION=-
MPLGLLCPLLSLGVALGTGSTPCDSPTCLSEDPSAGRGLLALSAKRSQTSNLGEEVEGSGSETTAKCKASCHSNGQLKKPELCKQKRCAACAECTGDGETGDGETGDGKTGEQTCGDRKSVSVTWYVAPTGAAGTDCDGQSPETPLVDVETAVERALPGDSILLLPGTYKNENYLDGDYWKRGFTLLIKNLHGEPDKPIIVKALHPGTAIIKSDAEMAVHVIDCEHVRIEGLVIYGEVEQIPLELARQYMFQYKDEDGIIQHRTDGTKLQGLPAPINSFRPSYFNTKGLTLKRGKHVKLINNTVKFMPAVGLSIWGGDYITAEGNTVHDNSRRSAVGTHGLQIHSIENLDGTGGIHFLIAKNVVYNNYNELYSWSEQKTFINPHIDEGKGISFQKSTRSWNKAPGRMLIANNLCYGNGFSGIHVNLGANIDVVHNTLFGNFASGSGKNIGISFSPCNDCTASNNLVDAKVSWKGLALHSTKDAATFSHNLVRGTLDDLSTAQGNNLVVEDLGLTDAINGDFHLLPTSPAINAGITSSVTTDFDGKTRDAEPDIGAFEF